MPTATNAAESASPPRKRLTVDMSIEEHRHLKVAAVEKGVSMRDLVMSVLRREGLITDQ